MTTELGNRSNSFVNFLAKYLWPFIRWVYRIELSGEAHIPQEGPFLIIANHNSGALIESHSLLALFTNYKHEVYGLNHQSLFKIPLVATYFKKIGAVSATREASFEVLQAGKPLLIFPGGSRQALRPLSLKNQNSFPWAKGWARIACEAGVDVLPVKFIGTHNLNPIFMSSKWVANMLVLPRLLGVKEFPVSLAQIIVSLAAFMFVHGAGGELWLATLAAYVGFLFSCLIPVIPAKVKIKFYPMIKAHQSGEEELLSEKMNQIMAKTDYPHAKRRAYPLNAMEQFMLLHESENVNYNSHFLFDFTSETIDQKKLLNVTSSWINYFPEVRTCIDKSNLYYKRYTYQKPWFRSDEIFHFKNSSSANWKALEDGFCNEAFELSMMPPVRFLLLSDGDSHRLIYSCHHSVFDGAAQAYSFETWVRLYNGEVPEVKIHQPFRYRSILKEIGYVKSLKLLIKNISIRPPRAPMEIATFAKNSHISSRKVSCERFVVPSKKSARKDFYYYCLNALHSALENAGDQSSPILCYLPTGLRMPLRLTDCYQNAVLSQNLYVPRGQLLEADKVKAKIRKKNGKNVIHENTKFIFGVLPLAKLFPRSYMQRLFKELDSKSSAITCTALLVNATFPKTFPEPSDWRGLMISARGTLLRSPNLGIILTGKEGRESICIQYIEGMVPEENILNLSKHLFNCFSSNIATKLPKMKEQLKQQEIERS